MKAILLLAAVLLAMVGCASGGDSEGTTRASPTAALIRGELTTEQYLEAVKKANEEDRRTEVVLVLSRASDALLKSGKDDVVDAEEAEVLEEAIAKEE